VRLFFSTALLGLAWFAAVNVLASVAAWIVGRSLTRRDAPAPLALLAVRLLPAVMASVFAAFVFAPGHIRLEPSDADESIGFAIGALALTGLGIVGRSVWRGLQVMAAARRVRRWLHRPIATSAGNAWQVDGFAGVSLAGVIRPRILVGSQARQLLTSDELEAAVAHEAAHRRAYDNVKRCVMFCAPDVFGWSTTAQRLEAQWRAAAESQADRRAVDGDSGRAVHLASALVKIARLGTTPRAALHSPVWSTFHEPSLLEVRVRQLVAGSRMRQSPLWLPSALTACVATSVVALAWAADAAARVHHLTEHLIGFLP
jgi:Zn-dependent protease with chaperone function